MTTRRRTKRDRTSSKSSTEASTSAAKEKAFSEAPDHVTRSDLPPSRPRKEILAPVALPGQKTPLHYFIYTLATAAFLFAGWYTYITAVGLKQWKDEVGWWGMTIGRPRRQDNVYRGTRGGSQEVKGDFEEHLNQLASALGIPATDIASAVKPFVPPATLSSLAPRATGEAMKVFFEEDPKRRGDGGMGNAAESFRQAVGFDDPLEEVGL